MDFQLALATKILRTGDLLTPRLHNLLPEYFTSDDARILYEYIQAHYQEFGEPPTEQLIKKRIPEIRLAKTNGISMDVLCGHVAEDLAEDEFRSLALQMRELEARVGATEAARQMHHEFLKLSTKYGRKPLEVMGDRADSDYKALTTDSVNEHSVAWVWPSLQAHTLGAHGGDVVIIYARRKKGKTFALLHQVEHAAKLGYKVLFIEPEMRPWRIRRRLYAIRGKWEYSDVRTKSAFMGSDKTATRNRLKLIQVMASFEAASNLVMQFTEEEEELSLEMISGLIEEVQPDIVIIDQLHQLSMGGASVRERDRRGQIVKRLRKMAEKYNRPFFCSTQSNRDGLIEGSDLVEQYADAFIKMHLDKKRSVVQFEVEGAREWNIDRWYTKADFCSDMSEISEDHPRLTRSMSARLSDEEKTTKKVKKAKTQTKQIVQANRGK